MIDVHSDHRPSASSEGRPAEFRARPEILLVEDSDSDRLIYSRMLEQCGLGPNVHAVTTLAEAVSAAQFIRFDCAILDFQLTDGTAADFLGEVNTAAVILSASPASGLEARTLQAGAQEYLVKGTVGPQDLGRAIVRAMDRQLAREQLVAENSWLRQQSMTDELTGLANRRGVEHELAREVARSRRHGRPLTALLIDCDDFKAINTRFGYAAGDEALCHVASNIANAIRPMDVAARIGGDEFLVLLPRTGEVEAMQVAGRMRTALRQRTRLPVTVTIGLARIDPEEMVDLNGIIKRCQDALSAGKVFGKDQTVDADALANSDAAPEPISQPIVRLSDDMPTATNFVLSGWTGRGIPDGERALEVDLHTLETLVEHASASTHEVVLGLPTATGEAAPEAVLQALAPISGPVCLRLRGVGSRPQELVDAATALRAAGRVLIGLELPSLEAIALMTLARVGPDRVFVPARALVGDSDHREVTTRILRALHALGATVVATEVSTDDEADELRRQKVEMASGSHFE